MQMQEPSSRSATCFARLSGGESGPHSATSSTSRAELPSISVRSRGATPANAATSSVETTMYATAARGWRPDGRPITGTPAHSADEQAAFALRPAERRLHPRGLDAPERILEVRRHRQDVVDLLGDVYRCDVLGTQARHERRSVYSRNFAKRTYGSSVVR